jgi:hypothetical protein
MIAQPEKRETAMKELSDEPQNMRELVHLGDQEDATVRQDDQREPAPEVFTFDGWGLVPVDLHIA